ncbi:MAG TPA: M15 family metallopeptidase [Armatimonadota bacterium]|jgi:D-alanyl-D-alanine dipeptidase
MTSYETTDDLKNLPIHDNGEPLVDFRTCGAVFAPRHSVFPFPRLPLLRWGVVARLVEVVKALPVGWTLHINEGFRPIEVQRLQFEAGRRRFESMFPDMDPAERAALLEDFTAPPDVPEVPPPHSTGGALDIRLLDANGEEVDLVSPFARDDTLHVAAWDAPVSPEARANREILGAAMAAGGITNYPAEYWHWSYGDQGWAHRGGHPAAIYGRLDYTIAGLEAMTGILANRENPLHDWPVDLPKEIIT